MWFVPVYLAILLKNKFTAFDNLPFLPRCIQFLRLRLLRFLGYTVPSAYVPRHRTSKESLGTGYLVIEYVDGSRGRMLSETWEKGRHNAQLRGNLFSSLSHIILTLSRIPLPKIGSFIVDEKGFLRLNNRPLTLEIQDLENQHIPVDISRDFTYTTVDSYINDILAYHESRLRHQPNAVNSIQDGLFQIAALTVMRTIRQSFFSPELRRGPFFMSLTDLHQSNIFVDDDWNVTCLVDLEWACSRPVEMIHPPYWLTNQSVDGIDLADYEIIHKEFMESLAAQNSRNHLLQRTLQDGWNKGTFWYSLALDSPTGLFRIFYDYIQPRFSKDHIEDASFFTIMLDYWAVNPAKFVQQKVDDKEQYDRLLLEAFK